MCLFPSCTFSNSDWFISLKLVLEDELLSSTLTYWLIGDWKSEAGSATTKNSEEVTLEAVLEFKINLLCRFSTFDSDFSFSLLVCVRIGVLFTFQIFISVSTLGF